MNPKIAHKYVWTLVHDIKHYYENDKGYPMMLCEVYQKWNRELTACDRSRLREYIDKEVAICRLKKASSGR